MSLPTSEFLQLPSPSLWDRISTWTSNNKAVVYSVAGVLVVSVAGGSVYYYNKRSSSRSPSRSSEKDIETATPSVDSKEKKKRKKSKKPSSPTAKSATVTEQDVDSQISTIDLSAASPAEKKLHADSLKKTGNSAYANKDYARAIDFYTQAIETVPDHVYYSNRAACYASMDDLDKVIEDTTESLRLNPTYVKALNRRALAYEGVGRNQEALLDYTASSIMDNFQNENAAGAIERLLKKIAEQKARDMLAGRTNRMPSYSFISAYLEAFRPHEIPVISSEDESMGDVHLKRALEATKAKQYKEAISHLQTASGNPFSSSDLEAQALNLSATYRFVRADVENALQEINRSLELCPAMTNSYVKRASMHMESGDRDSTLADFQKAIETNAEDPDIYYHRGQCNFILQDFSSAARDYQKSIDLDPSFVFSHIQLGVAQYKLGSTSASMSTFRRCLSKFPESPDVFNYYGELLLDQGKFEEATEKFDNAISLERASTAGNSSTTNVMPLINKALAVFQWKKDMSQAEELCRKALMLDSESDVALATLSQFLLTQGKAKDALQYFEKSAEVARTEAEIINALSYAEATRTQLEVERQYPDLAQKMANMAQAAAQQAR